MEANYALVYNLKKKVSDTIFHIKSLKLAEEARALYFTKMKTKKKGDIGVFQYDFENGHEKVIDTGRFAYDRLAINTTGDRLAYLTAKDSISKDSLQYELFYRADQVLQQVTDTLGKNLRKDWELSGAQTPYFSENSKRLYFYSKPIEHIEIDTTLLDEEINTARTEIEISGFKRQSLSFVFKSKHKYGCALARRKYKYYTAR